MFRLEFELPGLPKRINESFRGGWQARVGEARKWKRLVNLHAWPRPAIPLQRASLTLTRCSSVEPDYDGLVGSMKHVIDGLIETGVISGDKRVNIGVPKYEWRKVSRGHGKVIVVVEEVQG